MAKRKRRPPRKKRSAKRRQDSTPPTLTMLQRLTQGGPEYMEENFIRLMRDSGQLQEEPEFTDLYFDLEQTLAVSNKQFARFRKLFQKAIKRDDEDTVITTYDDYRIAVINELATPKFKQQLKHNLDRCQKRLNPNNQSELLECAAFVSVLMDSEKLQENFPLGIYGLVTVIYGASFDRAMIELPNAHDLIDDNLLYTIWQAKHETDDIILLELAVKAANTFEELLNEVDDEPELAVALQRQQEHLAKALPQRLMSLGIWFKPHFFEPDEIRVGLDIMEAKYLSKPWSLSRYITPLIVFKYVKVIYQTLEELMTPQRQEEAIAWWQHNGQICLTGDDDAKHALSVNVLAAVKLLQSEPDPVHSPIITSMYAIETFAFISASSDNLSPVWTKTFNRIEKSIFWKLISRKM